jgi:thiol-disulfide isomerase/thioredoxin
MKKTTSVLLFLFFSIFIFASKPRVIENPAYEVKNSGIYNISKIELNDTTTRVYIHSTFLPKWWVDFSKNDSIIDAKTKKTYKPIAIEGTEFDKKLWMPTSGDSTIVLIYPKLDESIEKIDFKNCIFGISLKESSTTIKKNTLISPQVTRWLNSKLNQGVKKKPVDFNSPLFFNQDTAHLIGYIKGYDPRLNFTTGIIYSGNEITNEDYPTVIRIYPDGRFEANYLLNHPTYSYFVLNDAVIRFYIEPGQTLSVILNWDEFLIADRLRNIRYQLKGIGYGGTLAKINDELEKYPQVQLNYKEFQKKVATLSPYDFKKDQSLALTQNNKKLETDTKVNPLSAKTVTILKNEILLENSTELFDFVNNRANMLMSKKDTTNKIIKIPITADYYDFLKEMPLNDNSLLVSGLYSIFINRFEFCNPLSVISKRVKRTAQVKDYSFWLEDWRLKDSVIQNSLGLKPNLTYDIAKIRSLKYGMNQLPKTSAFEYWDSLKVGIKNPFLIKTGNDILLKTFPENSVSTYELPKGMATDVFKRIIDPFKGKILFIDFWATTCGPCVAEIKRMKATREKYKDNPDFEFIFITDEGSSPLETYKNMVVEQELKNTFRINKNDFFYLRQLFKFNGIPHYAAIDKNGKVISDDFKMYNFEFELSKILSNNKTLAKTHF